MFDPLSEPLAPTGGAALVFDCGGEVVPVGRRIGALIVRAALEIEVARGVTTGVPDAVRGDTVLTVVRLIQDRLAAVGALAVRSKVTGRHVSFRELDPDRDLRGAAPE